MRERNYFKNSVVCREKIASATGDKKSPFNLTLHILYSVHCTVIKKKQISKASRTKLKNLTLEEK